MVSRFIPLAAGLCLAGCGASSGGSGLSEQARRGQAIFQQNCAMCHPAKAGMPETAPVLNGLVGDKAGAGSFPYSPAFQEADFVWTEEKLDAFLRAPRDVVPDNSMVFFGMEDEGQRADLIAYLAEDRGRE